MGGIEREEREGGIVGEERGGRILGEIERGERNEDGDQETRDDV